MLNERKGGASKQIGEHDKEEQRYRLKIEYDGTDFFGWQLQSDRRTVQGVLEEALERFFQVPCRVHGAGRTDTGVHALKQVAHFNAADKFQPDVIVRGLNHFLPVDVRILEVQPVSPDFHARFSAHWRWYRYRIFNRQRAVQRNYGWWPRFAFDPEKLHHTCETLIGEYDFTSFASVESERENCICHVYAAKWKFAYDDWMFHIVADHFLHHMVRIIVGTILDVARCRFTLNQFSEFLHNPKQNSSLFKAPAEGLCLMGIGYGPFPAVDEDKGSIQTFPFDINS